MNNPNILVVNTIDKGFNYQGVRYEIISLPFTEKDSLCDYFCIARARVFDEDIQMYNDCYTVTIGFMLNKDFVLGLQPVKIFVKNQISAAGDHIAASTLEIDRAIDLWEV